MRSIYVSSKASSFGCLKQAHLITACCSRAEHCARRVDRHHGGDASERRSSIRCGVVGGDSAGVYQSAGPLADNPQQQEQTTWATATVTQNRYQHSCTSRHFRCFPLRHQTQVVVVQECVCRWTHALPNPVHRRPGMCLHQSSYKLLCAGVLRCAASRHP